MLFTHWPSWHSFLCHCLKMMIISNWVVGAFLRCQVVINKMACVFLKHNMFFNFVSPCMNPTVCILDRSQTAPLNWRSLFGSWSPSMYPYFIMQQLLPTFTKSNLPGKMSRDCRSSKLGFSEGFKSTGSYKNLTMFWLDSSIYTWQSSWSVSSTKFFSNNGHGFSIGNNWSRRIRLGSEFHGKGYK